MKVRNKVKAKMANTFKKIIKKHKKKKLQAERNRKAKARERAEEEYADDYERRLSRHKRSVVKKTVITVVGSTGYCGKIFAGYFWRSGGNTKLDADFS